MSDHAKIVLQSEIEHRVKYFEEFLKELPDGMKLNLGCGRIKFEGQWVNVDRNEGVYPDKCFDFDNPPLRWPLLMDHFTFCVASHIVEHINNLIFFMKELYRVMKNGGIVFICCPYAWTDEAIEDPTHVRLINENSMAYFDRGLYKKFQGNGYDFPVDFKTERVVLVPKDEYKNWPPKKIDDMKNTQLNMIREIQFVLRVVKPIREIGVNDE